MAAPSVTNTFVANTTASASEVNANFSDIVDGLSSGSTWDVVVSTLTASTSITGTLATAAQANVTSLGTLTALNVSGTTSLDGAVTINDSGADVDFRVEASGVTNALFIEGSTGDIGIGTSPVTGKALTIAGSGENNTPPLSILMSDIGVDTFKWASEAMMSDMDGGEKIVHFFGQAASTRNAGYIGYHWNSSGATTNYVSIGHFGANDLLQIHGDGGLFAPSLGSSATANSDVRYDTSSKEIYYQTSLRKYKDNIRNIGYGLFDILATKFRRFECKTTGGAGFGVVVDEVEHIFPEMITKDENGKDTGFSYTSLIPVLGRAIQEQQAIIEALTARIEALEAK
jgi:hypothetical protein